MPWYDIFSFGSNGNYQLGLGHTEDLENPARCLEDVGHIEQLASGGNHTLAVSSEGKLYGCGLTKNGQLAGEKDHVIGWDPIYTGFKAKLVCAGWEFSVVVSDDDKVYTTGFGPKGELGVENTTSTTEFTQIPGFPPPGRKVTDVKAGMSHTVALLDDGAVYGWGAGRKGQIGEPAERTVFTPRLVQKEPTTTHIACGREYTVLANNKTGNVSVVGSTRSGVDQVPSELQQGFEDIQSGWSSIHALMNDGSIVSWGNNSNGQLAPATELQRYKLSAISAGTEHVLAITHDKKCLAWGWGEHGNCGGPDYKDGELNLIAENVDKVWGGYANSFYRKIALASADN